MIDQNKGFTILISALSLIVGCIILDIWHRIGRKEPDGIYEERWVEKANRNAFDGNEKTNFGLFFLAISLVVWFFAGLFSFFLSPEVVGFAKNLFSTFNSVFLLISISYFEYAPKVIRQNKRQFIIIISSVGLLVLLLTIYYSGPGFISFGDVPDFAFAIPTAGTIAIVYYRTFKNRQFKLLSYYTVITILLLVASQNLPVHYYHWDSYNSYLPLVTPFSKLSFIFIICFLGYSWEHDRYSKVLKDYHDSVEDYLRVIEERDAQEATSSEARENVWREVSLKAAHKLGNPLDAIEVFTDSLEKTLVRLSLSDMHLKKAINKISRIKEKIQKAKRLIKEFKAYGNEIELKIQDHDLLQIIHSSSDVIKEKNVEFSLVNNSSYKKIVTANNSLHALPGITIKIDGEKIRDCFDELFSNSLKWFTTTKRIIKIVIEDCEEADMLDVNNEPETCKNYIKVSYFDNTKGIKDGNKKLIFAPFFTTDPQGTGMGLSIVGKTVRNHKGFIYENGEHEKGAHFVILLPINN